MMETLRLIIHAPTANALERARRNLANLLTAAPDAQVELVINAAAVPAALSTPDALDGHLRVCQNSLTANQLTAPEGVAVCRRQCCILRSASRKAGPICA